MKDLLTSLEEILDLNQKILNETDFKKLNLKKMSPILKKSSIKKEEPEEIKIQEV